LFLLALPLAITAQEKEYVRVKPKEGDGVNIILKRYLLPINKSYINKFKELNKGKFTKKGGIITHKEYDLPVRIHKFNKKNIRTTLGIDDFDRAKKIQNYNLELQRLGIKEGDYKVNLELWVPFFDLDDIKPSAAETEKLTTKEADKAVTKETEKENTEETEETGKEKSGGKYEIFGKDFEDIKIKDSKLKGCFYYLDAGHGGPDPGAIGYKDENQLCEDEYAYDVTLRLGRCLIEHGATVYIIVRDPNDGIRNEQYLKCDNDEIYIGNIDIDIDQVKRLRKRASIINNLYEENREKGKVHQLVCIHVDSRGNNDLIDIFFYFKPGSAKGEKVAETVFHTIKDKYDKHQPGRGYKGSVTSRNLHMLRECEPTGLYIELGNIQNPKNQYRLIEKGNRQAIAEWLCEGLIKAK
jgi:N-acetylmuramoyl-L-alanine amidase